MEIEVGSEFTVKWSNGAGYSVYRVVDNPENGPHLFEVVGEYEVCNGGRYVELGRS